MDYKIFAENLPPRAYCSLKLEFHTNEDISIGTVDLAEGINSLCPFGTTNLSKHVADGKVSHTPVHSVWLCQQEPQLAMCQQVVLALVKRSSYTPTNRNTTSLHTSIAPLWSQGTRFALREAIHRWRISKKLQPGLFLLRQGHSSCMTDGILQQAEKLWNLLLWLLSSVLVSSTEGCIAYGGLFNPTGKHHIVCDTGWLSCADKLYGMCGCTVSVRKLFFGVDMCENGLLLSCRKIVGEWQTWRLYCKTDTQCAMFSVVKCPAPPPSALQFCALCYEGGG